MMKNMKNMKYSKAKEEYNKGNFFAALEIYEQIGYELGFQFVYANIQLCHKKLASHETNTLTSTSRYEIYNEGINRSSPILKIFLDAKPLNSDELNSVIKLFTNASKKIQRICLVICNSKTTEHESESIYFIGEEESKTLDYDLKIEQQNPANENSDFSISLFNFKGFLDSISNIFINSNKSGILYFVSSTKENLASGYHRRSLNLKKAFREIGFTIPLISYNSTNFQYTNEISFIPKNFKILELIIRWLNPKTTIAASNYENAKPILDIREKVGFEFAYEMRGLWHETYAAKMLEINKNYDINNDHYYKLNLNNELDVVRKADRVLFICEEMKEYIQNKIPEKEIKYEIVGNGYINKKIKHEETEVKKKDLLFTIGYFGSITYYEGIGFLLDALSDLISNGINIKLILIGKISITQKNLLDIKKYSFVEYESFKENIDPYYQKIDLFVIPRLPYEVCHSVEPLKPFDCFSRKVPLLMSDCKALNRLASNDKHCITFKSGNKVDFKLKLEAIIKNGYPKEKLETAFNWAKSNLNWKDIANKYIKFLDIRKRKIYFLYADKWWISYKWSGASINTINEMATLSRDNEIYYNNIYINDLFENGLFNESKFLERYSQEVKKKSKSEFSSLPKVFKPSKDYDIYFYRSGDNEKCTHFFENELCTPKIFSHNFVESIWNNQIIGFQTETSQDLAIKKELKEFDDDGTLGYKNCNISPERSFIRYQVGALQPSSINSVSDKIKRNNLKKTLNSEFLIGVIGTIYDGTYPDILIEAVERIRLKKPELNAKIVIYSINMLIDIPEKDWIFISKYEKSSQEEALLQLDVIVNTWKSSAQIYSGSNKNIDAINYGIPLIAAYTPSYVEQLGSSYPLFYDLKINKPKDTIRSIENLLTQCISSSFREKVSAYLLWRKSFLSIDATSWLYSKQFLKLKDKKLLLVVQNFNTGGVQKYSTQLIKSLHDYKITILSEEKITYEVIKDLYTLSRDLKILYNKDEVFSSLDQFDFAFINSFPVKGKDLLSLLSFLKSKKTKIYPIVHSDIHPFTVEISKYLNFIDGLISINKKIVDKIKFCTGINISHCCHHITPVLDDNDANKKTNCSPKQKRSKKIAFFGRIAPLKCVDLLVEYFSRYVQEEGSQYTLLICGPLAHKNLDLLINKENEIIGSKAIFLHNKSFNSRERSELFNEIDALIYTTATEGLPYTFLEANEIGLPVISSNVGAISHLIKDGHNGLLFNFEDLHLNNLYEERPYNKLSELMVKNKEKNYSEFKRVMINFESKDNLFYEMSKNAISVVNSEFSFEIMKKKLRAIVS